MTNQNFVISTTSHLYNLEITEYLGTVTAHKVAGTGIFSDLAAQVSDIFGGRSKSYQKQLNAIKNEVLNELKYEALKLNANGIIGMKLDFDEISGKGKSMLMVSAVGTAIRFINHDKDKNVTKMVTDILSSEQLNTNLRKKKILNILENSDKFISDDAWRLLIENKIVEAAPIIIDKLAEYINEYYRPDSLEDKFINHSRNYFLNMPPELIKAHIYGAFKYKRSYLTKIAREIINQLELFDFDSVEQMLLSNDIKIKKEAINLLRYTKPNYSLEDISNFSNLIPKIKENFKITGEILEKKKLLNSNNVKYWKCECGAENDMTNEHCSKCLKDIYGFGKDEFNPEQAIKLIRDSINVLDEFYNTSKQN